MEQTYLKKNDVVTITIEDMGSDGEGIGKCQGYPVFVKDAIIGDVAEVKIVKAKKNYAYGRLEKVLKPSSFRVEPKCPFHRQCGGCQIQAMSYEKQLEWKENKIKNNLQRIGGFSGELLDRIMEPIIGMEEPYYYRNKAQYPIGTDKNGKPIAGFYAGRTHSIVANTDCCLGPKENKNILEFILAFMEKHSIPAYDEKNGKGLVRHVLIRTGFATGEIMVCLVINGKTFPKSRELADGLLGLTLEGEKRIVSISISPNMKNTNVIMGDRAETLWGKPYIEDYIGEIKFRISPLSFYQVNPVQTEKLYGLALEYAGLTGKETVWDLYCGIGTISLFLAKKAKQVYGVEIVPQAILDAKENAKINQIENAEFFVGKAEEVLPAKFEEERIHADVIVVDPPRKGCDEACLNTMVRMQPERIVYVSCDSATLARDLKYLGENGYEIVRGRGVDQFGHSGHVETVCLLSKLNVEQHIEVEVNLDEMDLTKAESKATYEEIKAYVLEHSGLKVSNLYIAQVKRKCGIIERVNYNLSKSENSRQPKCPPEKEAAIREALKHFGMISL